MRWIPLTRRITSPLRWIRTTWIDPITGDQLGLADRASWVAQGLIRRWSFVLANVALSVFWWTHPAVFGDDPGLTRWMVLYSLLAVVIESVVGIGMFSQTRRDAATLREVRAVSRAHAALLEGQHQLLSQVQMILGINTRQLEATVAMLQEIRRAVEDLPEEITEAIEDESGS